MVERVSTFTQHNKAVKEFSRLQSELATIQRQISSGRQAATFTEGADNLTSVINLENTISGSEKFVDSNNVIVSRLNVADIAIQELQGVATDLKSNLIIANTSGGTFDVGAFANNALEQVRDNLNVKSNGRSLFAGGKTNNDAVSDLRFVSNVLNDEATSNYYQGDAQVFSIKASENLQLTYGVTADNPAFQNLIAGLHKAIDFQNTGLQSDFDSAQVFIDAAVDQLISVRGEVNLNRITLENANSQHQSTTDLLNRVLGDEIGVDIVEASIQSSLTEATLSASLQTFARISKLTLADFLR